MAFPKNLAKKLGHGIRLPKRKKRRLARKPPKGMSLRKYREAKPKRPKPDLGRNQKPLETVAEAKRAMSVVQNSYKQGWQKFVALTNLLSRAFLGKRNPEVIRLVEEARDKIQIRRPGEKPARKTRKQVASLSEATQTNINVLKTQLSRENFKNCGILIKLLVDTTPKKEIRIVANALESMALGMLPKIEAQKNKEKAVKMLKITPDLFEAAGKLYEKGYFDHHAKKMFVTARQIRLFEL